MVIGVWITRADDHEARISRLNAHPHLHRRRPLDARHLRFVDTSEHLLTVFLHRLVRRAALLHYVYVDQGSGIFDRVNRVNFFNLHASVCNGCLFNVHTDNNHAI